MWEWTRTESQGDYTFAIIEDHPNAWLGRVLEHRAVMENELGRLLGKNEVVHHKNEDKKDNRLENLEVMTRGEHTRLHHAKEPVVTECAKCGTVVTRQPRQLNGKRIFCSRSCSATFYGGMDRGRKLPEHGTHGRYRKGCRCDMCRANQAKRVRAWRSKRKINGM